jgi:hypothetical protein
MKKQTKSNWQTIVFTTIAAVVFMFAASSLVIAQKGIGAKYGARDPQPCVNTKAAANKPNVAEAVAAVICNSEGEFGGNLYLVEDVKVTTFGKGQRPNPSNRLYPSTPDLTSLEYEILGSFKKYQCSKTYDSKEVERSCELYDNANAKGVCFKNTFGSWVCTLSDQSVTDHTSVVPPGSKKATNKVIPEDKPTPTKNGNQTTEKQADTDENGLVKPDFFEMEKYFEIVKYDYNPVDGRVTFVVKAKKETNIFKWYLIAYDADDVKVSETSFNGNVVTPVIGEPTRIYSFAPNEKEMKQVTRIAITRKLD